MQLTVLGCGDAFGTGCRLQTSYYVRAASTSFLIDCGATTLIGMRREGLSLDEIDAVFISHLHGDHFGGLPWLYLDAKYLSRRTRPLIIVGPSGIEKRFNALSEALYPGTLEGAHDFDLVFVEFEERSPLEIAGITVTPFEVFHPSGAPPYALRFSIEGKVLSFTGDTGWVEALLDVSRDADLFITECFQYDYKMSMHLDYETIDANYSRLAAKRILLTHMGEEMLAAGSRLDLTRYELAEDGMTIDL